MSKDSTQILDSYRLAQYAVQVPCYICGGGNTFDAELCRACYAPMALAHQANTQKIHPQMIATIGSSGVGKTVYLGMLMDMLSRQTGRLQMLAVDGRRGFDTSRGQRTGVAYDITWVDIPEPDRPHVSASSGYGQGVLQQGLERGGAIFSRLEGVAFGGGRIYITATDGGEAKVGQVWEIDPRRSRLRLLFESPGAPTLNMPDNLALSPRGGLVLCEDGSGTEYVHGLTVEGEIFRFAQNNVDLRATPVKGFSGDYRGSEFAGACYSPDGKWLFVNVQSPGITFAITGPWRTGAL